MNHKKLRRLFAEERLQLRRRGPTPNRPNTTLPPLCLG
jgi:hypothetical protein